MTIEQFNPEAGEGRIIKEVLISSLSVGDTVRATTISDAVYEFKITDPYKGLARVARLKSSSDDMRSGDLGEKQILGEYFTVGEKIRHDRSITSPVKKLQIISYSEVAETDSVEKQEIKSRIKDLQARLKQILTYMELGEGTTDDKRLVKEIEDEIKELERGL